MLVGYHVRDSWSVPRHVLDSYYKVKHYSTMMFNWHVCHGLLQREARWFHRIEFHHSNQKRDFLLGVGFRKFCKAIPVIRFGYPVDLKRMSLINPRFEAMVKVPSSLEPPDSSPVAHDNISARLLTIYQNSPLKYPKMTKRFLFWKKIEPRKRLNSS